MDRVAILNGETLDEELLAESFGRTGISHYVARGLCKRLTTDDVDFGNAVVDMPPGKAYILHNGRDMMLLADARPEIQLGTDGNQHVYICYDLNEPEGERIKYEVSATQTEPALPSLRIAVIDMADQEVTPVHDLAPKSDQNALRYKGQDIDADGDGVVDESDTTNHVAAEDVEGSVAEADHADEADHASDADSLGANVTTAAFGAPVDANGYRLLGLRELGIDDGGFGWRFRPDGDHGSLLIPRSDGLTRTDFAIGYDSDGYSIGDSVAIDGNLEIGPPQGDGWNLRPGGGNSVDLIPRINSGVYDAYALTYSHPGDFTTPSSMHAHGGLSTNSSLTVGTGSGAEGYVIKSGAGSDSALIIPKINGNELGSSAIRYYNGSYTIHDDTTVTGKLSADGVLSTGGTGSGADGFIVGPADERDEARITPKINGDAKTGNRLRYYGGRWQLLADLELDGDKFRLPRVTSDPDDAEPGHMWYRADID